MPGVPSKTYTAVSTVYRLLSRQTRCYTCTTALFPGAAVSISKRSERLASRTSCLQHLAGPFSAIGQRQGDNLVVLGELDLFPAMVSARMCL